MALLLWPWGTLRLYWNSDRNQSCSAFILSYTVGCAGGDGEGGGTHGLREVGGQLEVDGVRWGVRRACSASTSALKLGIADTSVISSPVSRSRSTRSSVDVSAFQRSPDPSARTGYGGTRHEVAAQRGDRDLLAVLGRAGRRLGQLAVDVLQRALRQAPRVAVELGEPADAPVRRRGGGDGEQERVGPVHETAADVDERAQHLGDATGVVVGVEQRVGIGTREPGTDDPRAEHDSGTAERWRPAA